MTGADSVPAKKVCEALAANSTDEPSAEVVAESAEVSPQKRGFFGRIVAFLQQVISELKKVVTPTRKELLTYTGVVLVFVVIMMAIVGVFDVLFGFLTSWVFGSI